MNEQSLFCLFYSPRTLIPFILIQLPSRAAKEVVQGHRRAWPEEAINPAAALLGKSDSDHQPPARAATGRRSARGGER